MYPALLYHKPLSPNEGAQSSAVKGSKRVLKHTMLAASEHCTAAVSEGGALHTCGHDCDDIHLQGKVGRLGHSLGEDVAVLTPVGGGLTGKRVVSVALGRRHGVAATTEGEVFTWGEFLDHAAGPEVPALVRGRLAGKRVLSVSAGLDFSVAVTDAGELFVWDCGGHGIHKPGKHSAMTL
jgi:alpha-tubulin suppressor-like RCC1 family protein